MAISLAGIKAPIETEMSRFEETFRRSVRTKVALLDRIMGFIIKRKGKQMRPILVFLSAGVAAGEITERTHRGAALVELLHTATLIHDDIVDDSFRRRGFFSINALWKNKIAVLVGDYMLSRGLLLSVENEDYDLLKISSQAVKLMSEGELQQLEKTRRLNLDEEEYYQIIRKKTASLIASCCAMGAKSVSTDPDLVERMRVFGEKIGIAFQIKDDLFDYGLGNSGKPSGADLKEKKLTLPLIFALRQAGSAERKRVLRDVKAYAQNSDKLLQFIEFVRSKGGIAYAEAAMKRYRDEAMEILQSFPASPYRESLAMLVDYTISRDK